MVIKLTSSHLESSSWTAERSAYRGRSFIAKATTKYHRPICSGKLLVAQHTVKQLIIRLDYSSLVDNMIKLYIPIRLY